MVDQDLAALSPKETLEKLADFHFPPYITLAHIFNAPDGWHFQNRILRQYALQYVLDGTAEMSVEGKTYLTQKGDLIIYGPYEVHSIRTLAGCKYLSATIVFHFADSLFPFDNLIKQDHYLGNFKNNHIDRWIGELVAKYQQQNALVHMECQGLLLLILARALAPNDSHQHTESQKSRNIARLVLIKNHIGNHLNCELVPRQLEEIAGMTWNYIISQFAHAFGYTPMQFLLFLRVNKAIELALNTTMSFGEIANAVGYSNVHTFGKMFKKKTGVSLSQYCSSVYDRDIEMHVQQID